MRSNLGHLPRRHLGQLGDGDAWSLALMMPSDDEMLCVMMVSRLVRVVRDGERERRAREGGV